MALTWTVDHERRLSVATASGSLRIAERVRDGATGYRIIFDASAAGVDIRPAELTGFSRIASERKPEGFDGALALIASSDAEREVGAYFASRTNSERPCRVFSSVEAAHVWFAELDAASRD
jgi:hypothetical protein